MSDKTGKILIVDDDEDILVAAKLLLKRHFQMVVTCNKPAHIPELMAQRSFDAILLDMNFGPGESSGEQGFYWLEKILEIDPNAVVIMITAHGDINTAVTAIKQGATDFITKPWQNEKMLATLSASVKLGQSRSEADALKKTNRILAKATSEPSQTILGKSEAIQNILSIIERTAPTEANVLILGENGTGKELAARELHRRSDRAEKIFMPVDLGAIPESLFESELFGHRKGAFTDAREDRAGRLQTASGGTLFLDEIGNLPLHLQAKLLTVLEQRQVIPVGTHRPIPFDVRIVAATNMSPAKLRDEAVFRQDLLFRLNTVEITLPPLRERRADIAEIAHHYAAFFCRKYGGPLKSFSSAALEAIEAYAWPGNIRALKHAIERAVILSQSDLFQPADFQLASLADHTDTAMDVSSASIPGREGTDMNLERLERSTVQQALEKNRYNISRAAKDLGLTRAALYRRMEKYDL